MSSQIETFVLVRTSSNDHDSPIMGIVRTYLTKARAEEDIELLRESNEFSGYRIETVAHIDD